MRSALTNSGGGVKELRRRVAKVDFPEPLQPPKTNTSDIEIINFVGMEQ